MAHAAVQMEGPTVAQMVEAARAAAASCDEACAGAAAPTLVAQEAAARCIAARDNAAAAALVARASRARFRQEAVLASQEAAAGHADARSDAKAAALAAREASVRCGAASRRAVAAALAARGAADLQDNAGGANAADAFRAREAANLSIAVVDDAATEEARAAAAELAVPRVDAAAAAARQADVSCDEALAVVDPGADDDKKFLDSMRGWLMTVAALLVNMAFMAIIKPPSWVPVDFGYSTLIEAWTDPGPSYKDNRRSLVAAYMACVYLVSNAATFAIAILLVLMLLIMEKGGAAKKLKAIRFVMMILALLAACSFTTATSGSGDLNVTQLISSILMIFAVCGVFIVWLLPKIPKMLSIFD